MPDTLPKLEVDHQPSEHKPRTAHRLRYVWSKIYIGIVPLALALGASIAFSLGNDHVGQLIAMWAVVGLHILVLAVAGWFMWRKGYAVYTMHGIRVEFLTKDYYIPPAMLEHYAYAHVIAPMSKRMPLVWESLSGNRLTFVDHLVDAGTKGEVWGATYPGRTTRSVIYAPYALHPGVTAWELKLQLCQVLFPGQSEADDIAWLRSVGLA